MDSLPIELKFFIFDHLNLRELLQLRLLCKEYESMIRNYRVRELVFEIESSWRTTWFYTNRLVVRQNMIPNSRLALLKGAWPVLDFSSLQQLRIDCLTDDDVVSLEDLNQLGQLQHLEIFLNECVEEKNRTLCLPNLKTLALQLRNEPEIKIVAPKLEHFFQDSRLKSLEIKHPLSIRFLSCIGPYDPDIEQFKNLEHFRIAYASGLNSAILSALPKLKRLNIDLAPHEEIFILNELIREKTELKRNSLRLYYKEVELTKFVFRFDFDEQSDLVWQMKNYSLLANQISSTTCIDYLALMRSVGVLPKDFFERFINIQEVTVCGPVIYRNSFLNFIQNCKNLSRLELQQSHLDQSDYDRLPEVCSVFDLKIQIMPDVELDYTFLKRMPELRNFETNQTLHADTIWMLAKLRPIKSFSCLLSLNLQIRVDKRGDGRFDCTDPREKCREDLSLAELIELCGHLRWRGDNGTSQSDNSDDHTDQDDY